MTNEQVGEAVIDAVIPSFFSSIQLVGVAMYNASHSGMIFLFCAAFGILYYVRFVVRSADTVFARRYEKSKRKMELDGIPFRRANQARKARNSSLISYLQRLSNMLMHSLQDGLTISLNHRIKIRIARHHEMVKKWGQMNLPSSSQGVFTSRHNGNISPRSSPNRAVGSVYLPPVEIASMIKSIKTIGRHGGAVDSSKFGDTIGGNNEPVITKSYVKVKTTKLFTPLIHLDPDDLISCLRSRLLTMSGEIDEEFFEVTADDLHDEFKIALKIFCPDGVLMSEIEQTEACELFFIWKETQNYHFSVSYCNGSCRQIRMINFELFKNWFINELVTVLHNNLTDRLLDHTLRQAPSMRKRLSTISASYVDTSSPLKQRYSIPRLDMKGLNTVTPESLTDRSDLPSGDRDQLIISRYMNDATRRDPTMRRKTISLTTTSRRRSHHHGNDDTDATRARSRTLEGKLAGGDMPPHDPTMREKTTSLTTTPRRRSHHHGNDDTDATRARSRTLEDELAGGDISPQNLHEMILSRLNADETRHDLTMRRKTISLTTTSRRRSHHHGNDDTNATRARSRTLEGKLAGGDMPPHDPTMREKTITLTTTSRRRSHHHGNDGNTVSVESNLTSSETTPRDWNTAITAALTDDRVFYDEIPLASKTAYPKRPLNRHLVLEKVMSLETPLTSSEVSPRESLGRRVWQLQDNDQPADDSTLGLTPNSTTIPPRPFRYKRLGRKDLKVGTIESLSRNSSASPRQRHEMILSRLKWISRIVLEKFFDVNRRNSLTVVSECLHPRLRIR